MQKLFNSSLH